MISHKLKFIFIHIPKTSGNSLSIILKDVVDNDVILKKSKLGEKQGINIICEKKKQDIKHKFITYYNKLYGSKINNYFKFTIVRNPYDRMLSYYFYSTNNKIFNKKKFIKFINKNTYAQHQYIDPTFYIVRYENLVRGLKNINSLKKVIKFNQYPKINKSINSNQIYKNVYKDKQIKDLVYNKYKKDFLLFGYKY